MKKPVSELTGPELAEWVARARGWEVITVCDVIIGCKKVWLGEASSRKCPVKGYRPDINGVQAMELVKEFGIDLYCSSTPVDARTMSGFWGSGETPEIAICRAVVASKFGEFVEVSDE